MMKHEIIKKLAVTFFSVLTPISMVSASEPGLTLSQGLSQLDSLFSSDSLIVPKNGDTAAITLQNAVSPDGSKEILSLYTTGGISFYKTSAEAAQAAETSPLAVQKNEYLAFRADDTNSALCTSGKTYLIKKNLGLVQTHYNETYVFLNGELGEETLFPKKEGQTETIFAHDLAKRVIDTLSVDSMEKALDVLMIEALLDAQEAIYSGDDAKLNSAINVMKKSCSEPDLAKQQFETILVEDRLSTALSEASNYITLFREKELPPPAAFTSADPIPHIFSAFGGAFGTDPQTQLFTVYLNENGFNLVKPEGQSAPFQFIPIVDSRIPEQTAFCKDLGFTYIVDPTATNPQNFGFMLKTERIDSTATDVASFLKTSQNLIDPTTMTADTMAGVGTVQKAIETKRVRFDDPEEQNLLDAAITLNILFNLATGVQNQNEEGVNQSITALGELCGANGDALKMSLLGIQPQAEAPLAEQQSLTPPPVEKQPKTNAQ